MKKVTIILIIIIISTLFLSIMSAEQMENQSNPEFKIYLGRMIYQTMDSHLKIYVENIGNAPAHNVTLKNLSMDGLVLYNDRGIEWRNETENDIVEPGERIIGYLPTTIFGLGRFTITLNVTCDEDIISTGIGYGFVLGFFVFIP